MTQGNDRIDAQGAAGRHQDRQQGDQGKHTQHQRIDQRFRRVETIEGSNQQACKWPAQGKPEQEADAKLSVMPWLTTPRSPGQLTPKAKASPCPAGAPSALRTPISRVLSRTVKASTPYRPAAARNKAMSPNTVNMRDTTRRPNTASAITRSYPRTQYAGASGSSSRTISMSRGANASGSPAVRTARLAKRAGCWRIGTSKAGRTGSSRSSSWVRAITPTTVTVE